MPVSPTSDVFQFPKKAFVYICDYDEGEPVFAFTTNLADIHDEDLENVALYELKHAGHVEINRKFVD